MTRQSATKLHPGDIYGCFELIKVCPGGHSWEVKCIKCGWIGKRTTETIKKVWTKNPPIGCDQCKSNHHYRVGEKIGIYEILKIERIGLFQVKCTKCGSIMQKTTRQLSYIKNQNSKYCSVCSKQQLHPNCKHKPGEIIKNYKLIKPDPEYPMHWIVECIKCGRKSSLGLSNIKKTKRDVCFYCLHPEQSNPGITHHKREDYWISPEHSMYQVYKRKIESLNSKGKKQKEFTLSENEYKNLIYGKCFYCGQEPTINQYWTEKLSKHNVGDIKINGIDRINSDKGYSSGNCVSCCSECNHIKMDMNTLEFIQKIQKINSRFSSTTIEKRIQDELSRVESSDSKQSESIDNQ